MCAERIGRCLCGAVGVTVHSTAHDLSACHCDMCRRWTGVAFLSIGVAEDGLRLTGTDNVRSYSSSDWAERSFCATCGSTLWYRLKPGWGPNDYYIAAGLLDDLSGLRLTSEIYIDHKPAAFAFTGPTTQMTEAEFLASFAASPKE